ncbi:hypothetical protein ACFL5V_03600 [Fibrobacterota bacterium]
MEKIKPTNPGDLKNAGFKYYVSGLNAVVDGQNEHAVNLLTRAVEMDSDIPDAYFQLGKIFIKKGELKRGQRLFRDLLLRQDIDNDFRNKVEDALIRVYLAGKDFHKAQELAEHRTLKYPYDSQVRLTLTHLLEHQKDFKSAEKHWQAYADLLKIDPRPKFALYKVETSRIQKSLSRKTRQNLYLQALKLDPTCAPAYVLLARLYREEGKNDLVLETWNQLMKEVPEKSIWIFQEMEEFYFELHRYQELLGLYQALCRREGTHQAAAGFALARLYHKTGRKDLALETITRAHRENSSKENGIKELIRFYLEVDKTDAILKRISSSLDDFIGRNGFFCKECHAQSEEIEWHCPECGAWESYTN